VKIKVKKGQYSPLLSNESKPGNPRSSRKLVPGMNCVYRTSKCGSEYRVALCTEVGWKHFGEFCNLGTAAYVANVAILSTENALVDYDLNKVRDIDSKELQAWRRDPENEKLESIARMKHADLKKQEEEEKIKNEEEDLKNLSSMSLKELLICRERRKVLGENWQIVQKVYESKKQES